ncbi:hypothetical protein OB955_00150 [Halobacteria archaeon AArc-m2/3/4]|uniref:Uncharacterized protein n=1 Tax=Natronoglomus mannanivorans TaxID=2979990 RepID=A0ABT2Q886_9EURY|nr:hypothetical protein [Halobacteria archaeon AArc-m2/3/4]
MQRVIDRKLYDTDAAEQIAKYAPLTDRSDFHFLIETLYKTSDGEYFLHAEGGAATKHAEKISNEKRPGEEIQLLTDEDALDWCEEREIEGETVVKEFDNLIET